MSPSYKATKVHGPSCAQGLRLSPYKSTEVHNSSMLWASQHSKASSNLSIHVVWTDVHRVDAETSSENGAHPQRPSAKHGEHGGARLFLTRSEVMGAAPGQRQDSPTLPSGSVCPQIPFTTLGLLCA